MMLEYESEVVPHIDKIQGFECVYKACELLLLLSIGFRMEPHLSLYAWLDYLNAQLIYKNLTYPGIL